MNSIKQSLFLIAFNLTIFSTYAIYTNYIIFLSGKIFSLTLSKKIDASRKIFSFKKIEIVENQHRLKLWILVKKNKDILKLKFKSRLALIA